MSTALVQPMTEDAARRITERIRATVVHTRVGGVNPEKFPEPH